MRQARRLRVDQCGTQAIAHAPCLGAAHMIEMFGAACRSLAAMAEPLPPCRHRSVPKRRAAFC